jgi:hypothetical protein
MGEVVNLKRFKKRVSRDQAAKDAQEKRTRFGRTKAQRQQDQGENRVLNSVLDHHRLNEEER